MHQPGLYYQVLRVHLEECGNMYVLLPTVAGQNLMIQSSRKPFIDIFVFGDRQPL
jgi:hypothetical protein